LNKTPIIVILATLIISVSAGYNMVPQIYAQSSAKTTTGCIHGSNIGLICVSNLGTHRLPTGKWLAEVDGVGAILTISSIGKSGKIDGTIAGGNATCAIRGKPCEIHGTFDTYTGRISFLATSTYRPPPPAAIFVPPVQNYTGIESQTHIGVDQTQYQIEGIGKTIRPMSNTEFGWSATKMCLSIGCIG
jgi:hypothetical protein